MPCYANAMHVAGLIISLPTKRHEYERERRRRSGGGGVTDTKIWPNNMLAALGAGAEPLNPDMPKRLHAEQKGRLLLNSSHAGS